MPPSFSLNRTSADQVFEYQEEAIVKVMAGAKSSSRSKRGDSSSRLYWASLAALLIALIVGGWFSLLKHHDDHSKGGKLNVAEDVSAAHFSQVRIDVMLLMMDVILSIYLPSSSRIYKIR